MRTHVQANDRDDGTQHGADAAAALASRGRGGLGRRDTEDLYVLVKPHGAQAAQDQGKSSKRRLFGGVMDRFDNKPDARAAAHSGGVRGRTESGSSEPLSNGRQHWFSPERARKGTGDTTVDAKRSASDSVAEDSGTGVVKNKTATGTWTKPSGKKQEAPPDRFSRFLGKMLGVKDDALPEGSAVDGKKKDGDDGLAAAAPRRRSPSDDGSARGAGSDATARGEARPTEIPAGESGARSGSTDTTPCATAVYSATPVSTATADALPVAVAVAMPLADPAPPTRRPSRSGRSLRPATSRSEGDMSTVVAGTGDVVLISEWVAREERDTGGPVRVFSAQRVLEGKVKKKCRLAVSRKNLTQVRPGFWWRG